MCDTILIKERFKILWNLPRRYSFALQFLYLLFIPHIHPSIHPSIYKYIYVYIIYIHTHLWHTRSRPGRLTVMAFPAVFSPSVWSSCSEESVSSRACSSSSEGRRALRYGMVLGRAAITDDNHRNQNSWKCSMLHSVITRHNLALNKDQLTENHSHGKVVMSSLNRLWVSPVLAMKRVSARSTSLLWVAAFSLTTW